MFWVGKVIFVIFVCVCHTKSINCKKSFLILLWIYKISTFFYFFNFPLCFCLPCLELIFWLLKPLSIFPPMFKFDFHEARTGRGWREWYVRANNSNTIFIQAINPCIEMILVNCGDQLFPLQCFLCCFRTSTWPDSIIELILLQLTTFLKLQWSFQKEISSHNCIFHFHSQLVGLPRLGRAEELEHCPW